MQQFVKKISEMSISRGKGQSPIDDYELHSTSDSNVFRTSSPRMGSPRTKTPPIGYSPLSTLPKLINNHFQSISGEGCNPSPMFLHCPNPQNRRSDKDYIDSLKLKLGDAYTVMFGSQDKITITRKGAQSPSSMSPTATAITCSILDVRNIWMHCYKINDPLTIWSNLCQYSTNQTSYHISPCYSNELSP